jgi:hypothetical protein
MVSDDARQALAVLGLTWPVDRETLEQKRDELLHIWNPHRYANLTNNPKKYMQMFKKGEAMTKEIEAAYTLLSNRLKSS